MQKRNHFKFRRKHITLISLIFYRVMKDIELIQIKENKDRDKRKRKK